MIKNHSNIAVILAGGSGNRLDLGYPKQLAKVAGRTIIEHTVTVFHRCKTIDTIIIVTRHDLVESVLNFVKINNWTKVDRVIAGGNDRFGSSWAAIEALQNESEDSKILFHDAVRPFVTNAIIETCLTKLDEFSAVDVVIPTVDTMLSVDESGHLGKILEREQLRRGQTPQGFILRVIRAAYNKAINLGQRSFTCDCGVVKQMLPTELIALVPGNPANLKITYTEDLFLADKLFQSRGEDVAQISGELSKLDGKTMVVFGGSEGIGKAIAQAAQEQGATVYCYSRSTTQTDVSDRETVRKALLDASVNSSIDFIINTAAILIRKPLKTTSEKEIHDIMDINIMGTVNVAIESYSYLKITRGSLLNFASSSYTRGRANYSLYSASKSAVVNFSQALSEEWFDDGIRVNCINPERTRTPMRTKNFGLEPAETLLDPRTVSDASLQVIISDITGQVIDVRNTTQT